MTPPPATMAEKSIKVLASWDIFTTAEEMAYIKNFIAEHEAVEGRRSITTNLKEKQHEVV